MTPRSGPGPTIARSSIVTRPDVGDARPARRFSTVVLPQPDGPTITMNSPWRTSSVRLATATVASPALPAKRFSTPSRRSLIAAVKAVRPVWRAAGRIRARSGAACSSRPRHQCAHRRAQRTIEHQRDDADRDHADDDAVELDAV